MSQGANFGRIHLPVSLVFAWGIDVFHLLEFYHYLLHFCSTSHSVFRRLALRLQTCYKL
jgi:hypothetical protein